MRAFCKFEFLQHICFFREGRRSGSTVEGGGQEFAAEVGVFRQNPGTANGLFVKRVNSGGVVQLGERLQLRSVVRGGDGKLQVSREYHSTFRAVTLSFFP